MLRGTPLGSVVEADRIRVEAGAESGPIRASSGSAVVLVAEGAGFALDGDVWVEVGPGDRLVIDPDAEAALRAGSRAMTALVIRSLGAAPEAAGAA